MNRVRLWVPEPDRAYLLTMNTARARIHWRKWADLTAAWREQAKLEAQAADPKILLELRPRVQIEALPVQGPGGTLADPLGHAPTLKAVVDGLRDAGWLIDDSGRYVSSVTMLPPVRGKVPGLLVDLIPLPIETL